MMTNPILYMGQIFSYRIDDKNDLQRALDLLHEAFDALYSSKLLRGARSAVGFIEVVPTDARTAWNIHAHVIIDADANSIDVVAANAAWQRSIGSRHGGFTLDEEVRDRERLSSYISKRESYSPTPGSLTIRQLEALLVGLHKRRLIISRGVVPIPVES